jgi:hypothetical protein
MNHQFLGKLRLLSVIASRYGVYGIVSLCALGGLQGCQNQAASSMESSASAKLILQGVMQSQRTWYASRRSFATAIDQLTTQPNSWVQLYRTNGDGYSYRVEIEPKAVIISGTSLIPSLKSLVGGVFVDANGQTSSILCEANQTGVQKKLAPPTNSQTCGSDTVRVE